MSGQCTTAHTHIHTHTYTHTHIHTHIHAHAHTHTYTHTCIRCADSGGTAPSVQYIMATASTSSVLWDISTSRLSPDNHNCPLMRSCDKNCKHPTLSLALKHNALTLVDALPVHQKHTVWGSRLSETAEHEGNKPALWTREHSLKLRTSPISSSHCQCYQGSQNMNTLKSVWSPKQRRLLWECTSKLSKNKTKTHQRPT